jgi:hypothetical protein
MATLNCTTYSEIFCCGNCHDAVMICEAQGGDLVYACSNPACQKVVSVDSPEALAIIKDVALKLPVRRSRNAAHRQQRWANVLDHIAALPEPEQTDAINFTIRTMETIMGDQRIAA